MTNGWTFDLYAIAFAALVCGVCGVILLVQDIRSRRRRPYDWEHECPDLVGDGWHNHVRRLP